MDLKNVSAALLLCGLAACGSSSASESGSSLASGAIVVNPGTGTRFVVDANLGGNGTRLEMVGQPVWGRLVDIWAAAPITGTPTLYFTDFLIGQEIRTDLLDFTLDRNPVTSKEVLTILHTFGTANFDAAFGRLEIGLQPFLDKSLDPGELPPFTALPRNAAMMIRFNDLLADGGNPSSGQYPGSVSPANIKLAVGYPPVGATSARILPDPNHGDIVGGSFHSTRVLIDMSVSQAEAISAGVLPNAIGLPAAITSTQANVVVRIPTLLNAAAVQLTLLTNLSGNELAAFSNGSVDPFSPTQDVVRAFRSGGETANTGDPFNGFLRDDVPPRVLGSQAVNVTFVGAAGSEFLVDMQYSTATCATQPLPGDMLVLPGIVAEVTQLAGVPVGGAVASVQMKLIGGSPLNFTPGPGSFRMPWSSALGVQPECFVRFSPVAGQLPNTDVSSDASVVLSFSEPVFPRSANGFTGMRLAYNPAPAAGFFQTHVVGMSTTNQDLTEVTFTPSTRLNHTQGSTETYDFDLTSGLAGILDLAGNPLATTLPQTSFQLLSLEPSVASGSIALQFSAPDEDQNGGTELRGQLIFKPGSGEITTRSVNRFSAVADDSQLTVATMFPTYPIGHPLVGLPVSTDLPLTRYGARLQSIWRHADLGLPTVSTVVIEDASVVPSTFATFALEWEDASYNLDVEGLAWAPLSAGVSGDFFPEFELSLTHATFLPEEGATGTGLAAPFAGNPLVNHPAEVVHEKHEGYVVSQLDSFLSPTGTLMAPWPLNREKAISAYKYFTYRDTSITEVAGPGGAGADPLLWLAPPTSLTSNSPGYPLYAAGFVPSICLPLLMDFRVFPDPAGSPSLNLIAGRVSGFTSMPSFRAYSAGHNPATGQAVTVNPDQETQAAGTIANGLVWPPIDDMMTLGQVDFVVRVNRIHSVWLDAGVLTNWKGLVIDPPLSEQPSGTSITVAFRGALTVTGPSPADASKMDPYGDPYDPFFQPPNGVPPIPFVVTYLNGDSGWKTNLADLDGARLIQMRITMTSNVESNVSPTISALGLTFEN